MKNKNIEYLMWHQKISQEIYSRPNLPFKLDNVIQDYFNGKLSLDNAIEKEWKRVFYPHAIWDGKNLIWDWDEIQLCTK